jgi:hypothetical protein
MRGLCCECIHYIHGKDENPCAKGSCKVGYLKEGCWQWQGGKDDQVQIPTKRCPVCGETFTIDKFFKAKVNKDGLSRCCKTCFMERKKQKQQQK